MHWVYIILVGCDSLCVRIYIYKYIFLLFEEITFKEVNEGK